MQSSAFFALLFLAATAAAQTPAEQIKRLQNDPNIIWIGEVYRDYEDLDKLYEGRNIDRHQPETLLDGSVLHNHKQRTSTIKRAFADGYVQDWEHYIWGQLIQPNVPVFADENLTKRLSAAAKNELLTTIDTIVTFNPDDLTETLHFATNELSPLDIYAYRLRQLVYYNAKENMYFNLPLSIAPMQIMFNDRGDALSIKPLFWMPIVASSTPINPSQANNMSVITSVAMDMPLTDAKVLKKSKPFAEVNKLWLGYIQKQKDFIFATTCMNNDNPNQEPLPSDELAGINVSANIVGLRINQTFGWDEQKKMWTIATYSTAPIAGIYDAEGNFIVSGALFYLYPHRRFKTVPR